MFGSRKLTMPTPEEALPGRGRAMPVPRAHAVNGESIQPPFPEGIEVTYFGMGCFWGAEQRFWQTPGVFSTAVGYTAGYTKNPTYEEVCTGMTGHNEAVMVAFDPNRITYEQLLALFWEGHDPTQGMRQGNDQGTQYRSGIYTTDNAQFTKATAWRTTYQNALTKAGHGTITTEIASVGDFFYAEEYHQQYLAKNPGEYCGIGGTGVGCPTGLTTDD